MRAAVIERPGEPIRIEELDLDDPRAREVRVRLQASGVCHSDLHVRDGDWERPGPLVLGHEGAGIVDAVGPGVDPSLVGRLVALTWYYPCLRCAACQTGRQWACTGSGSIRHRLEDGRTPLRRPDGTEVLPYLAIGTMSEAIVVPASAAIPMPDGLAPEVAALIGCCVSTGVGAVIKTATLPPGATIAVWGLGGVGLSVVMGAVLAGAARIVAVDRVPFKLERAQRLGATHTVRAGEDPAETVSLVREAAGGGPEFAFEAIGLPATIEQAIASLPPGGTAVLVGLTPFGARASFEVFPFVDGSRRIVGSNYGWAVAATDFPRYAALHRAGRLPIDALIDDRIPLAAGAIEDAFARMRRGEGVRTVIVP
ncbi:MAG TPA: alcohol dehydrogenase catalytic domain-containing protein [Candidatus Limnocylindrales bacterium]|jgi:S-(hydroxymethyl)glutathione dehydrogenase/alcohol dehydrogenase